MDTAGNESVVYSFGATSTDGRNPCAALDRDAAGNLYGTTTAGGAFGWGTVFKITPGGKETILYSFTNGTDGGVPEAGVTHDAAGNLYGTTDSGGAYDWGNVFKLDPAGNFTVLYSFTGGADSAQFNSTNGVVLDAAGNIYGSTYYGGSAFGFAGFGVIYKITP